jgi:hypothetical protein
MDEEPRTQRGHLLFASLHADYLTYELVGRLPWYFTPGYRSIQSQVVACGMPIKRTKLFKQFHSLLNNKHSQRLQRVQYEHSPWTKQKSLHGTDFYLFGNKTALHSNSPTSLVL